MHVSVLKGYANYYLYFLQLEVFAVESVVQGCMGYLLRIFDALEGPCTYDAKIGPGRPGDQLSYQPGLS